MVQIKKIHILTDNVVLESALYKGDFMHLGIVLLFPHMKNK